MFLSRFAKVTVVSALSALPVLVSSAAIALAEPVEFILINRTSRTLIEFYASPPNIESWEENILGGEVLEPGESAVVTIDDGRSDCLYDIKGVLAAGAGVGEGELIQSAVNICDGATYEYFD